MKKILPVLLSASALITGAGPADKTLEAVAVLQAAAAGTTGVRSLTPYLLEISRNGSSLPENIQTELRALGYQVPPASGSLRVLPRPSLDDELRLDQDIFRFHYTLSGTDAVDSTDGDHNGIPDYVDDVAAVFEQVYASVNGGLGFTRPPGDGFYSGNGGSGHYDVYLLNLAPMYYGITAAEQYAGNNSGDNEFSAVTEQNAATSFMELRNNYRGSGFQTLSELENIQVTVAHEFFHAVQFGYDVWEAIWLMEATSVWMEEVLYDDINDCYQYMPGWFDNPEWSLDRESGSHFYGSFIFFTYIEEHLGGQGAVRSIWERCITHVSSSSASYSLLSIDEALQANGSSFAEALNNMVIANLVLSASPLSGIYRYSEADQYPVQSPTLAGNISFSAGDTLSVSSSRLERYASQYYRLNAFAPVSVTLTKHNPSPSDLQLHAVIEEGAGTIFVNSGPQLNILPLSAGEITLAVVSQDTQGHGWDYTLYFQDGDSSLEVPHDFTLELVRNNPLFPHSADMEPGRLEVVLKTRAPQDMRVRMLDLGGRHIVTLYNGPLRYGTLHLSWNGRDRFGRRVPSGIYVIAAEGEHSRRWVRLTVIK